MRILGLDPSSKTGYVILDEDGNLVKAGVFHYKPAKDRFARYEKYEHKLIELLDDYEIDLVIIEGFSFAGKFNNSFQYELGTVYRMALYKHETMFVEVPPTTLKKFITGKGNSKKDMIMLAVYKYWDFDPTDDNEADAYGLAQFGRGIIGEPTGVPVLNFSAVESFLKKSDQIVLQEIAN